MSENCLDIIDWQHVFALPCDFTVDLPGWRSSGRFVRAMAVNLAALEADRLQREVTVIRTSGTPVARIYPATTGRLPDILDQA